MNSLNTILSKYKAAILTNTYYRSRSGKTTTDTYILHNRRTTVEQAYRRYPIKIMQLEEPRRDREFRNPSDFSADIRRRYLVSKQPLTEEAIQEILANVN